MPHFLQELQRRSVFQVAAVYAAVSFIVLQVADLTFPALSLSESAYRIVVWVVLAGFPVALFLAWFFDIRPASEATVVEPAATSAPQRRFQFISLALIVFLLTGAAGVSAVRARLGEARAADGRIALAVFPFHALGDAGGEWSEGLADLLATALDGTEGMRVLDPWSLWHRLERPAAGPLTSPDPARASEITRQLGGRRMLLGSVIRNAERVDVTVRIYDPRFTRALAAFSLHGRIDDMSSLVDQLSIAVITRLWDSDAMPGAVRLEPNVTGSPEALKAYLSAKAAMRRGWVDSAANAIDRAITLDSTFALALVDAVIIKSWHQFMTGRPYMGHAELLERAAAHADSLSQRNRLRLQAHRATIETNGAEAANALKQIIQIDSLDIAAWSALSYVQLAYGWQYGEGIPDALASAERVVRLDSSYVPGLVAHAWLALATDSPNVPMHVARLSRTDTSLSLPRSTMWALRLLKAGPDTFDLVSRRVVSAPFTDWIAPLRVLRTYDLQRASILFDQMREAAAPGPQRNAVVWTQARLRAAQGRTSEAIDLARRAGDPTVLLMTYQLAVAAALSNVADDSVVRQSVQALGQSAQNWWTLWLQAAYHAQMGDTVAARRLQAAIGKLPDWGEPSTYRDALVADVDARLAARAGRMDDARTNAQRALALWATHTENQHESMPEPAFRFHYAMLLKASAHPQTAEPLLRSLVPPTTWFGFHTARASYELGELAMLRNDTAAARRHYTHALQYWGEGGSSVARWRAQADRALGLMTRR